MNRTHASSNGDQLGRFDFGLCVGLVLLGVAARLLFNDIPNFAPVAGLALFAGYYCRQAMLAVAVPLSIMLISDQFLGGYDWKLQVVNYLLLAVPVAAGGLLRVVLDRPESSCWSATVGATLAIVGSSLAGSVIFFVGSNFAVWCLGTWYPHTLAGLSSCMSNGLPFFRYTLTGDLTFSLATFAALALLRSFAVSRRLAIHER